MKRTYSILAKSGIRIMELVKMLKDFKNKKLVISGEHTRYPPNYFRDHKKAFYVFMQKTLALFSKNRYE